MDNVESSVSCADLPQSKLFWNSGSVNQYAFGRRRHCWRDHSALMTGNSLSWKKQILEAFNAS